MADDKPVGDVSSLPLPPKPESAPEVAEELNADAGSPETVNRAMRKMAARAPEGLVEMTAMMGTMMGHPLHQKMTEAHIGKMLDLAVQHDTNEHDLRKNQQRIDEGCDQSERKYRMAYFCIFVALVVLILVLFRNQPTVLVPILTGVGGVVGGFIGGIGYARANPLPSKGKSE